MDSLDRTNVVQSLLSSENLQEILTRLGILREGQTLAAQAQFQGRRRKSQNLSKFNINAHPYGYLPIN
jgi:hypothetical protein